MIRNIQRRYFEIWGDEEAQNAILKYMLLVLAVLFSVQSIVLTILAFRGPTLFAIEKSETKMFKVHLPSDELLKLELSRTISGYVETHYNWDANTVEKAHLEASKYVGEKFVQAFNAVNLEQVKIAKEKKISQKVFLSADPAIDFKAKTARVTMDRILVVEGLRATNSVTLDINFEYGPRTEKNPEGIYIIGEKVIN